MRFAFRRIDESDIPVLERWFRQPHVIEWWDVGHGMDEAISELFPTDSNPHDERYLALLDGAPVGYVQSYWAIDDGSGWWRDQHDPSVRGIDLFLGDASMLNRGIGTEMTRQFCEHIFSDPAVSLVQIDPDPENTRAIRSYEKAGFRRVKLVETPDGTALLLHLSRPA